MSAIPIDPLAASIELMGPYLGPRLIDNEMFNANPMVEVAEDNISRTNQVYQQEKEQLIRARVDQARTEINAEKPRPEEAKGHNVNAWA